METLEVELPVHVYDALIDIAETEGLDVDQVIADLIISKFNEDIYE